MEVIVGGSRRVTLDKSTVLNEGGEAIIHHDPGFPDTRALKIYRSPSRQRASKVEWMIANLASFTGNSVMRPLEIVTASRKGGCGFSMQQLTRRFVTLDEIFSPSTCGRFGITTKIVADMFTDIARQKDQIHQHGMCIGDFNDKSILFHQERFETAWVDVDSWHTDAFPCTVGTQLYLVPELYGVPLDQGSYFRPEHDEWSYAVLLFRALLRKHPFKAGTHPTLLGMMERAKAGITVLDNSVQFPPTGLRPEILTDELTEELLRILKGQSKGPFPINALEQYSEALVACSSCGVWYPSTRTHCPQCTTKTAAVVKKLTAITMTPIIEALGPILWTTVRKHSVFAIAEVAGKLVLYCWNQKGASKMPLDIDSDPHYSFGVFDDTLVISHDEGREETPLYLFDLKRGGAPLRVLSTLVLRGGSPVFATTYRSLFRIAEHTLLCARRIGLSAIASATAGNDVYERPVTQVFRGQCWFDAAFINDDRVLGVNRDMGTHRWFLSTVEESTVTTVHPDVAALTPGETLLRTSVKFGSDRILVARRTRLRGREFVRLDQIDQRTGTVIKSEQLAIADHPQWENVDGLAFGGGIVMHPTDNGIVREKLDDHTTQVLQGTGGVIDSDDKLLPFGQEMLVVQHSRVVRLSA